MFGADATIAYVDENGARAEDYYLSGYTQVGLFINRMLFHTD